MLKPIRSAARLAWLVLSTGSLAVRLFLQGQTTDAAEHVRMVGMILHDDLVTLVAALQRIVVRPIADPHAVDRILIVKLDRIGDMVNATPTFDALRER